MKEGRLSSDLQERYGISNKDAVGKVLWHSLNESGDIGVYDMKFGNTILVKPITILLIRKIPMAEVYTD